MGAIDKWISTITFAGIAGLLIINYKGTVEIFDSISKGSIGYVTAVQGR